MKWAPWNVPLKRRLQTACVVIVILLPFLLLFLNVLFILMPHMWLFYGMYIAYIYFYDKNASKTGDKKK